MTRHECRYWRYNVKYHYRYCEYCGRFQYDYGQVWKDRITLENFIHHFAKLGGTDGNDNNHNLENYDIVVYCAQFFEFNAYDSWGAAMLVKMNGIEYGPYPNLNSAMFDIDRKLKEAKISGSTGT